MKLSGPIVEKNAKGETVVHLEAVEEFLDYSERLEEAVNRFGEILNSKEFNEALVDVYDPERTPSSEVIIQTALTLKNILAKVV